MISTTAAFDAQIQKDSRTFRAQLLSDDTPISGEIKKIIINKGACGKLTIGSIYSSYIEVTLDNCEDLLENRELQLQIGLVIDDSIEYINMGYYTVTNPETSAYSTTFTAVGRITSKLNTLFDVPEVLTLENIAAAITTATGVTITFNGEVSDAVLAKDITGMTCKEALSVIAGTFGGFATEDNSGNIVVSKYNTDSKVSVDGDRMTSLPEFNDYDYELYGVKVIVSAEGEDEDGNVIEEVAFTEGTPRLTVNNEFMTTDLFESFVANTVGYTYRPGTVPLALGDPRLQPWDCLEVTDVKDNVHTIPCLNIVHTFDGGLSTTITAPGESESESDSSVAGPITQQLERMNSLLITAQEAIIKRLKADDLEAEVAKLGYASVKELEAVNATIEDLNAKDAEITGKLTANDAAIESLQAKDTEITGLLSAANAEITNLKAKDAEIEGTLSAATADITDLKAKDVEIEGTLSAATADITDLKAKDAEIEGTLTATNAEITSLKAKDVEIDGQLTAVSASIDELKVKDAEIESLVAEKASVEDLEAVTADIEELVAKDAEIEALVAKKIDAETVEATYLKAADLEAEVAEFGYAKATDLEATNLTVSNLSGEVASFKTATAENFSAITADITEVSGDLADYKTVVAGQFSAKDAEIEALETKDAEIENLVAENLEATNADIEALEARDAEIENLVASNLEATNASIASLQAEDARIAGLFAGYATVGDLNATNADIEVLVAAQADFEEATAQNFSAVNASIEEIAADYVTTAELDAESAEIQKLFAGYATVDNLTATNANVTNLTTRQANFETATADNFEAVNADIANIEANYVKTTELEAESAEIRALFADYATVTQLNATNGNIETLSSTVAKINSAYMDEAEVESLVVGKGYLTEAQVDTLVTNKGYFTEAQVDDLVVGKGYITTAQTNTLLSDYVKTSTLTANYITASSIASTYATIASLNAQKARIDTIVSDYVKTDTLEANYITSSDISSTYATIDSLDAVSATLVTLSSKAITTDNLSAQVATLGYLKADALESEVAEFGYLKASSAAATYATIDNLDAANARIDGLDATYATIDLANVEAGSITTAMIGNGVVGTAQIADGSITDAKIVGLTANKITAGTLDAGTIEVINLNAANITVGTINGQQIASGAIDTSKLESSLSSEISTASTNATTAINRSNQYGTCATAAGTAAKVVTLANFALYTGATVHVKFTYANTVANPTLNINSTGAKTIKAYGASLTAASEYNWVANATVTFVYDGSYWQIADDAALSKVSIAYEKVTSKGEQLIVNGTGMLGDNTNFTSWTFDGSTTNNSPGSFTKTAGTSTTLYTDEFFPVSTNNTYTFSLDAKSLLGTGTLYSYMMFYDVDKKGITASQHMYVSGSTTTLARDLTAGDTVIYLTDVSGWSTTAANSPYMAIWNYTNSFGYTYPAETYTRNRVTLPKSGTYLDSSYIDYDANTITLTTAYSGDTIPAGTSVSQGRDGSTYKYVPLSNTKVPTTWTHYSGTMSGVDYSGTNKSGMFPPGTAYAKLGFLWNYNKASGEQQWITNVSVTDTTVADKAQSTADGKNTVFYQTSAPSTSGRKTNDIWFDTDNGTKMYYWNGSAWTAQQFSTSAIAASAITAEKIASGAITAAKIAANTITANEIASGAITTDELDAEAVTAGKIAANAITAGTIAADAVTTEKIASGAVVADSIASEAITADKIVASAITTDKIAANAVTGNKILAGEITADHIAAGTITATQIASGSITVDRLDADELEARVGSYGYLVATELSTEVANLGYATIGSLEAVDAKFSNYVLVTSYNTDKSALDSAIAAAQGKADSAYSLGDSINSIIANWCYNNDTTYIDGGNIYTGTIAAEAINAATLSAITADLGTVTAGVLQSENYQESDYSVGAGGTSTSPVLEGLKIDLNNKAYYTPQITIKDNYIALNGYMTIGKRGTGYDIGAYSFAQGYNTVAEGMFSHAEGTQTIAAGASSHAEGTSTRATDGNAHAEGYGAQATGFASHAEGDMTIASGEHSHAEGNSTNASSDDQHVQGKYNIVDTAGLYAHIVGNGSASERSNAHTLDWSGNAWYAGNITADGSLYEGGTALSSKYVTLSGSQTISGAKTTTGVFKVQNGSAAGAFVLGANVNSTGLTANQRKLGRMGIPAYTADGSTVTSTVAGISFDAQPNANYADFGGHPNNTSSIAPDVIRFVVANAHNNTVSGARSLVLQISKQAGLVDIAGGGTSVASAKFFIPVESTGSITATGGFVGELLGDVTGNAATATKATQDGNGNVITDTYATKEKGVYYVEGTGSTAGTWTGSHDEITEYYDGLTIAYKLNVAGASATTLNINGLGAITVRRNTGALTTHLPVNTVVLLVYTTISGTGYWVWADYSVNYAVRQYYTTANGNYPLLSKYDAGITTTTNYVTKYSRYSNKFYINPSTGVLTAPTFSGALEGNADTATKLETARTISLTGDVTGSGTFDGSGNLSITATVADDSHTHSDYVSKSSTVVQTMTGGLNLGGTPTAGTGVGRLMITGSTNPLIGLQAIDSSGNKLTPYYFQVANNIMYLGPTSSKALTFDSSGNVGIPAALTVTGSISEGGTALSSKYALASHTHNYAGSSSTGGAATTALACTGNSATATALTTSAGSAYIPVYFSGGKPVACTKPSSGNWFNGGLLSIGTDGVAEYGRYIDFHGTSASTNDYDVRIDAGTDAGKNTIYLPAVTGQAVVHTNNTQIGSATKPVYIASSGMATAGSTYAGGTAVTLNGSSKAGTTASFYAPTEVGTSGYVLKSSGSGAPTWQTNNTVNYSDGTGYVIITADADPASYYYFKPYVASKVYCGSENAPWYKVFTERLEVTEGRIDCQPTYDNTVSYATNMFVGSGGVFSRTTNTSSRTIKHDIKELSNEDLVAENLYKLPVHQFKYNEGIITDKTDARYMKDLPGFIIEEMNEVYPIAVDKPSDNVKDWSWNSQYLIPPMLKLIQDQHEVDISHEGRLARAEAQIEILQEQLSHAMITIAKQQKEIDSLRQAS